MKFKFEQHLHFRGAFYQAALQLSGRRIFRAEAIFSEILVLRGIEITAHESQIASHGEKNRKISSLAAIQSDSSEKQWQLPLAGAHDL